MRRGRWAGSSTSRLRRISERRESRPVLPLLPCVGSAHGVQLRFVQTCPFQPGRAARTLGLLQFAGLFVTFSLSSVDAQPVELRLIGMKTLETGAKFEGTAVGGLSGMD